MACPDPLVDVQSSTAVVLLRASKGPEDPYLQALSSNGLGPEAVHFIPVLHYEYLNKSDLCSDLLTSDKYSGIVFTSQTAVEACLHSLTQSSPDWESRVTEVWRQLPVFVVGKATAQAVCKLGLSPTGSFSGNAEALSKVIIQYFRTQCPSRPLLFPCGNLRRETITRAMEEAGIVVKCLICYNTLPHPEIEQKLMSLSVKPEVNSVWVVFFSPSGVNFALKYVKARFPPAQLKVAAIGGTTADSLRKAGVKCSAIAKQPNPDSLVTEILQCQSFSSSLPFT